MKRESLAQREACIVDYQANFDALHEDDHEIQNQKLDPIAFIAKTNEDNIYFDQAIGHLILNNSLKQ